MSNSRNMKQAKARALQSIEAAITAANEMMVFARDDKWSAGEHEVCSDAEDRLIEVRDALTRIPANPKDF